MIILNYGKWNVLVCKEQSYNMRKGGTGEGGHFARHVSNDFPLHSDRERIICKAHTKVSELYHHSGSPLPTMLKMLVSQNISSS